MKRNFQITLYSNTKLIFLKIITRISFTTSIQLCTRSLSQCNKVRKRNRTWRINEEVTIQIGYLQITFYQGTLNF